MPGGLTDRHLRDTLLVTLAVASGAVDATCWLGLGKVFSAFMTGNLAFLGFSVAGADGPPAGRTLLALAGFAAGAALAARIIGSAKPASAWPPRVTTALAVSVALQAAFLAVWLGAGDTPSAGDAGLLLAISGVAMGVQTTAVFALGVRASFTTAATATVAVLMGDLAGWSLSRRERLRLTAVIAGVVGGAALGGVLVLHAHAWAPVLPLALAAAVVGASAVAFRAPAAAIAAGSRPRSLPRWPRGARSPR
jgi:uncharacterized membrane protein YoaK (UPF0700 family)